MSHIRGDYSDNCSFKETFYSIPDTIGSSTSGQGKPVEMHGTELLVKCHLFLGRKLNEHSDHTIYTVYTQPDNLLYYSFLSSKQEDKHMLAE